MDMTRGVNSGVIVFVEDVPKVIAGPVGGGNTEFLDVSTPEGVEFRLEKGEIDLVAARGSLHLAHWDHRGGVGIAHIDNLLNDIIECLFQSVVVIDGVVLAPSILRRFREEVIGKGKSDRVGGDVLHPGHLGIGCVWPGVVTAHIVGDIVEVV